MSGLPSINGVEIPFSTKERPRCRRALEKLCEERGVVIDRLWQMIQAGELLVVPSLKKQCKKMAWEAFQKRGCRPLDDGKFNVVIRDYEVGIDGVPRAVLWRAEGKKTTDPCPFCGNKHRHDGDGERNFYRKNTRSRLEAPVARLADSDLVYSRIPPGNPPRTL